MNKFIFDWPCKNSFIFIPAMEFVEQVPHARILESLVSYTREEKLWCENSFQFFAVGILQCTS